MIPLRSKFCYVWPTQPSGSTPPRRWSPVSRTRPPSGSRQIESVTPRTPAASCRSGVSLLAPADTARAEPATPRLVPLQVTVARSVAGACGQSGARIETRHFHKSEDRSPQAKALSALVLPEVNHKPTLEAHPRSGGSRSGHRPKRLHSDGPFARLRPGIRPVMDRRFFIGISPRVERPGCAAVPPERRASRPRSAAGAERLGRPIWMTPRPPDRRLERSTFPIH
jgi:hypothetical protein